MIKVLFVCTGNICRSPTAEGVLRHLAAAEGLAGVIETDSAGTAGYHVGQPPDPRTIAAAAARGIDLRSLRARRVSPADFERFDLIVAMDRGHLDYLIALRPAGGRAEVKLLLDYHPSDGAPAGKDVPDPYDGDRKGFDEVLDLITTATHALLLEICTRDV